MWQIFLAHIPITLVDASLVQPYDTTIPRGPRMKSKLMLKASCHRSLTIVQTYSSYLLQFLFRFVSTVETTISTTILETFPSTLLVIYFTHRSLISFISRVSKTLWIREQPLKSRSISNCRISVQRFSTKRWTKQLQVVQDRTYQTEIGISLRRS